MPWTSGSSRVCNAALPPSSPPVGPSPHHAMQSERRLGGWAAGTASWQAAHPRWRSPWWRRAARPRRPAGAWTQLPGKGISGTRCRRAGTNLRRATVGWGHASARSRAETGPQHPRQNPTLPAPQAARRPKRTRPPAARTRDPHLPAAAARSRARVAPLPARVRRLLASAAHLQDTAAHLQARALPPRARAARRRGMAALPRAKAALPPVNPPSPRSPTSRPNRPGRRPPGPARASGAELHPVAAAGGLQAHQPEPCLDTCLVARGHQ